MRGLSLRRRKGGDSKIMQTQPSLIKEMTSLIDETYSHFGTSLLTFRFPPFSCPQTLEKIQKATILHTDIDGKDLYVIDHFFSLEEKQELDDFSSKATFSINSYGSKEAIDLGETPARTMNAKERWQLFAKSPKAIQSLFSFFSLIANELEADITTLPWELCDKNGQGSPSILANKVEQCCERTRDLGRHKDYDPEKRLSFAISVLYSETKQIHKSPFVNGEPGRPWMLTVMIYSTAHNFFPQKGLGTVFYNKEEQLQTRVRCLPMRLVFFEGDICHSIEESQHTIEEATWRISYVFKVILNPKKQNVSCKQKFMDWVKEKCTLNSSTLAPHL
jgi:hypothetical protein